MGLGFVNVKGGGNAADVPYDNSISGLSAETVQGAIDEMVTGSRIIDFVPAPAAQLQYTGNTQVPTWLNYDSDKLTISGDTSGTDVDEYTAIFTPKSGYQWFDGTTASKSVSWFITVAVLPIPAQAVALPYDGSSQSPTWDDNYDNTLMTLGGTTSAINAGSYEATFTLTDDDNYQWEDGTTEVQTVPWQIDKIAPTVTAPTAKSNLKYTGSAQALVNAGSTTGGTLQYSTDGVTYITAPPSGTNVGNYIVYYRVVGDTNYKDVADQYVSVSIARATGSLSLDKNSMTMDVSALTDTITASGTGAISAVSSDSTVAEVTSIVNGVITIVALKTGTATITVSCAANASYTAPADQTCSVVVDLPSATLADNTPAKIQAVAQAGLGANYWSVGDKVLISFQNVTVGKLSFNGLSAYAFIIGFNHNQTLEGLGIDFQFGKTATGKDIAFVDSTYDNQGASDGFKMHKGSSGKNSGGWASSYMRNTICTAMFNAMPNDWQEVIANATKYTDNVGGGAEVAGNVSATTDKIFLLGGGELVRQISVWNRYENDFQAQYEYYANGNSKIKYRHTDPTATCWWWLRSPCKSNDYQFCIERYDGYLITKEAHFSYGFAPAFRVA